MATPDFTPSLLNHLEEKRSELKDALLAQNSKTGYYYGWSIFARWSGVMGFQSLPASPDTLALFITAELLRGRKVSTVEHRVAAVARMHRLTHHASPVSEESRDLLRGARRLRTEDVRQVLPITIEELRAIAKLLLADDTPISLRNLAIILTGFTGALRNANTAALMVADVEFVEKGATLKIWREKNRQEGRQARLIGLPHGKHPETCCVNALKKWLERRGSYPGPLFTRFDGHMEKDRNRPLLPERIGQIVQIQIERIGLDWRKYGGHSLRAGFCTEAGIAGAPDRLIAAQTGHQDMAMLRTYFRKRDVFVGNAAEMLDL